MLLLPTQFPFTDAVTTDLPRDPGALGAGAAVGPGPVCFSLAISPMIPTTCVLRDPAAQGVDVAFLEPPLPVCLAVGPPCPLPIDSPGATYSHPDMCPRLQGPRSQMLGRLLFGEQHGL